MDLVLLGQIPQHVMGLDLRSAIRRVRDNLGQQKDLHRERSTSRESWPFKPTTTIIAAEDRGCCRDPGKLLVEIAAGGSAGDRRLLIRRDEEPIRHVAAALLKIGSCRGA